MKKYILLYGFNQFNTDQIRKAFTMRNYKVVNIDEEQYNWKIGELIGEFEVEKEHGEPLDIPGKMAVISGLEKEEVEDFFATLMNATGKLTYHKAVVTDTNKNWTSARLFMEVDREYREIKKMEKFKKR